MRSTSADADSYDGVSDIDQRTISQLTKHSSTDSPRNLYTMQATNLRPTQDILLTTEYISPLAKTFISTKECDIGILIGLYKSMIPKHKGPCEFYASYLEDFADTENWHSNSFDYLKEQLKVGKNRYLVLKAKNETLAQRRLNRKFVSIFSFLVNFINLFLRCLLKVFVSDRLLL